MLDVIRGTAFCGDVFGTVPDLEYAVAELTSLYNGGKKDSKLRGWKRKTSNRERE